jgi:hypothetical protein
MQPQKPLATEMPTLPCPNCQENILQGGFYNYCTETTSLREDNYTHVVNERLYIEHDENGHETVNHECDTEARCRSCDEVLPWPLYQIRSFDGDLIPDIAKTVAELLAEVADAPDPETNVDGNEERNESE